MEPAAPQPPDARQPGLLPRWQRVLHSWLSWSLFIPLALYVIAVLLQKDLVGKLAWFASCAFCGCLLVPFVWSSIRANPGIFRLRWLRFVIGGTALIVVAAVGNAFAYIVTGSTEGVAQTVLGVLAAVGFITIPVAMFDGLLGASKRSIERYRASH